VNVTGTVWARCHGIHRGLVNGASPQAAFLQATSPWRGAALTCRAWVQDCLSRATSSANKAEVNAELKQVSL
jgi:hypothetical protein